MTQQSDTGSETEVALRPGASVAQYTGTDAIMARMEELFLSVPMVDTDSLTFVAQVLNTTNIEDLIGELESKLPKAEDVAGRKLKVNGLTRNKSDIADSTFPWYLIVDSTDTDTGDRVLWQTSAGEPASKLLRIYEAGRLPCLVETRKVGEPTQAGYYPVNLIVWSLH